MRPRRLLGLLLFCNVSLLSYGSFLTRTTAKHERPHAYGGNADSRRSFAARDLSLSNAISSRSNSNSQDDDDNDYSALIPRSSSYVPSGLTVDEYQQIKTEEAHKLAGLNLGAWGPKFLRNSGGGGPPAGDWMVMPALWTRGYDSNYVDQGPSSSNNNREPTWTGLRRQMMRSCRANAPAFVLALVAMGMIRSLVRWAVARFLATSTLSSTAAVVWRTLAAAIVAAVAAPQIRSNYLERWSRRLLWSQRRLWCASVASLSVVWIVTAKLL